MGCYSNNGRITVHATIQNLSARARVLSNYLGYTCIAEQDSNEKRNVPGERSENKDATLAKSSNDFACHMQNLRVTCKVGA